MFEIPEMITLAKQFNETLKGKEIHSGNLGNSPHKFVWYNRSPEEFAELVKGKRVGESHAKGRWLFTPVEPGFVLVLGECGGKVLFHKPGSKLPKKYHLYISFSDGSFLTATTQMWGAMELFDEGKELEREYVKGMKPTPIDPEFTFGYFSDLIDKLIEGKKQSAKGLLTQDQTIPGLGNAIAQDILFKARLHPRHALPDFTEGDKRALFDAIQSTVAEVIEMGGRYDEYDLYGNQGKYIRLMDKNAAGNPCPECGTTVEKIQYLGGA
jgi:formamidopyrimidine-DNA glycosylase